MIVVAHIEAPVIVVVAGDAGVLGRLQARQLYTTLESGRRRAARPQERNQTLPHSLLPLCSFLCAAYSSRASGAIYFKTKYAVGSRTTSLGTDTL